jgi:hypothetical protein
MQLAYIHYTGHQISDVLLALVLLGLLEDSSSVAH